MLAAMLRLEEITKPFLFTINYLVNMSIPKRLGLLSANIATIYQIKDSNIRAGWPSVFGWGAKRTLPRVLFQ